MGEFWLSWFFPVAFSECFFGFLNGSLVVFPQWCFWGSSFVVSISVYCVFMVELMVVLGVSFTVCVFENMFFGYSFCFFLWLLQFLRIDAEK